MRSKALLTSAAIMLAVIFISGACSAGFLAGRVTATPGTGTLQVPTLPGLTESTSPEVGATSPQTGSETGSPLPTTNPKVREDTPRNAEQLFEPFWQAWEIIHLRYVDQPVDDVALMRGAIRGMLEALGDEHTSYMDPDEFTQANISLASDYEGIGAWVDPDGEYLTIVSPMPGSPAEDAGLQPGDQVIAIDGEDMTGIDGNLVIRRVLGPAGTTVRLTIRRPVEGQEAEIFDVDVVRAKITLHSVTGEMLDNNIAYININSFGETTSQELEDVLTELLAQNPSGLIVDVRNNGGGFLDTAIDVTSQFIGDGVIMYEVYGDGSRDTYEAQPGGLALDIPMVVLVNEGSASASEIFAGAIQDYERAQLVGATTFGKGSVQQWIALDGGNEGAVRVTIARWITPNERQIHQVGLAPDIEVPLTEEDFAADRDPQLDKAIELLLNQN